MHRGVAMRKVQRSKSAGRGKKFHLKAARSRSIRARKTAAEGYNGVDKRVDKREG